MSIGILFFEDNYTVLKIDKRKNYCPYIQHIGKVISSVGYQSISSIVDSVFNLGLGKQLELQIVLSNGSVAYEPRPNLAPVFDGYYPRSHYRHLRRGDAVFKKLDTLRITFDGFYYIHSFNVYAASGCKVFTINMTLL